MGDRANMAALITARRAMRGALGWGAVFGLVVLSSFAGFKSAYPTLASRQLLARTLGSNAGMEALFGPARRIDTVAGFTAWRSLGVLVIVGAVWGLLTGTRLMRGEEEAGRWELVLAGHTTRGGAAAGALAGMGAGAVVLWGVTALIVTPASRTGGASVGVAAALFFALTLTAPAAIFLAVGALCSQLAQTRRQSNGLAAGVFGVSYAIRLVADSGSGVGWLRWFSPLGWVEALQPLTNPRPVALLPMTGFIALTATVTVWLAGRRDVGGAILPSNDSAAARTGLLGSPLGLAVRLARPASIGWAAGIGCLGFVVGLVAKSAGEATAGSKTVADILTRLGGRNQGAAAYLGLAFVTVMAVVALAAAGQVVAGRDEEGSGRLDNLLVRSTTRTRWMLGHLAIASALLLSAGVAAGAAAWLGAASQGTGLAASRLLIAGINTVPPALFVLGLGTLTHAVAPRLAGGVAYGVVAWSFLVDLVGSLLKASPWLLDLSVFHHVAPVPASDPRWASNGVMAGVACAFAVAGVIIFNRRDLAAQ